VHTAEVAGVAPSHRVERAGDVGITAGLREELQVLEGRSPSARRPALAFTMVEGKL